MPREPQVEVEYAPFSRKLVLSITLDALHMPTRDDAIVATARAALLDAKVQVDERLALSRYRAFVERVAQVAGRDYQQRDDLTGYQLDALASLIATRTTPKEPIMSTKTEIPSAFETAANALAQGVKRGVVSVLVMTVRPPTVRLIAKTLGKQAGTRADVWLKTAGGEAVFSVAVGGLGLGAQALGLTGRFTEEVNNLCGEAIAQGIHGGAKAILTGALGEIFAAYTDAVAKIKSIDA